MIENEDSTHLVERERPDNSLSFSSEQYKALLRCIDEMFAVMTDRDCNIIFCNDYLLRITGWDRSEVIGQDWRQMFLPDAEKDRVNKNLSDLLADQPAAPHFESEIKTRSGELRLARWTNTTLRDLDGSVVGVASLGDDITERKKAEQRLGMSESRYKKIVENAPEGIVVMDIATRKFVDFNEQALKLFKLTAEEIVKIGPEKMSPEFQPDGTRSDHSIVSNIQRAIDGETPVYEWTHLNSKGEQFPTDVRLLRLPDESRMLVIGSITDISEKKRIEQILRASEERYRDLVENSNDIIYTHDLNGKFTSINGAGERIVGYTRDEALVIAFPDILAPDYVERASQNMARILAGENSDIFVCDILAKDGRRLTLEVSSSIIFQHGVPVGIQGTARDVTDHNRLERQVQQSQKLESVGQLAGGIAHDFNNMLTAINGYSDLVLQRLANNDPLVPYIAEIRKAGARSAALTQQLLAFGSKQVMQPKIIDLSSIVAGIEDMLRRLIGENITLETRLSPDLGLVNADPGQIEMVILNLIVNARDAMPNGGRVIVETKNIVVEDHILPDAGSYVLLRISDNGTGIADEAKQHIFEPFFTTKGLGKGTGLGLSTAYGIVNQSGGSITVESTLGQGATFNVYLPLAATDMPILDDTTEHEVIITPCETILLIEDEAAVRAVIREILTSYGYKVFAAATGSEAMSICENQKEQIDLIVSDVVMAYESGPTLAKKLLAIRPDMKVLYLSGYPGDAIAHHGILDSDLNFLQKPFASSALAKKVREVLTKLETN